jgi:hypothetical protein
MNLNHYAATPSDPAAGILGCGAHTDYGALTFLLTDEVPGLQVSPSTDVPRHFHTKSIDMDRFVEDEKRELPTICHSNCRTQRVLRGCQCHPGGGTSWSTRATCWSV